MGIDNLISDALGDIDTLPDDDKWHRPPRQLMDIARECRELFVSAIEFDPDLEGLSLLEYLYIMTDLPAEELKDAIIVSGIYAMANDRIKREIAGYSRHD